MKLNIIEKIRNVGRLFIGYKNPRECKKHSQKVIQKFLYPHPYETIFLLLNQHGSRDIWRNIDHGRLKKLRRFIPMVKR